MKSEATLPDPFAIALGELVFEKLESGEQGEAFSVATTLTGIDPSSGKVWWLFGISASDDFDIDFAVDKLSSLRPLHALNEYNAPSFDSSHSEAEPLSFTLKQNIIGITFCILLFVLQIITLILAFIGLLSWRTMGLVLLFSLLLLGVFVLRNAARLFLWNIVTKAIDNNWEELRHLYWKLIVLSSRIIAPLKLGSIIRPEPYSKIDTETLSELRHSNKS
ncbi:MAG: hypothetical protein MI924_30765, partial [Chloroflexales bacterium]|nr:hypothetical protein [Chloroflexales bacterium]